MIDRNRLARTFEFLVKTDSVSKNEADIAGEIRKILTSMGAEVLTDGAGEKAGSNTGNLIARFAGTADAPALMLNAHMDTVEPGKGVTPSLKDGVFTSDGTTILGADDKSAIAILIEAIRVIQENEMAHAPLELVLTICEEVGLMGAKYLDYGLLTAKYGYALDTTDTEAIITQAPGANRFDIRIHGKDAHAGVAPEKGINAIVLAAEAIAGLEIGRIDAQTTCNIGMIEGGTATNIVPSLVTLRGEVRSHVPEKLNAVTERILAAFEAATERHKPSPDADLPRLEVRVESDFTGTHIPDDHPVVIMARQAAANLGRTIVPRSTGGGADANVFFEKGIVTGVLGTGMKDMHTVRESVALEDMVRMAELIIEIIRLHTEQYLDKNYAGR